jgi:hypothetical protein
MAGKSKSKAIAKRKQEIALMPISMEDVQNKIIVLRDEPVILDRDVAALYGVETREINQAVKNNPDKFPAGYLFVLNNQEVAEVRSKILTTPSENTNNEQVMPNFLKSHYNPIAFTERGLYMMATILKSKQAVLTTLAIIDTFASVKELARTIRELNGAANKEEQKGLLKRSGELIGDIIGNDMATSETETELELNFAVLKVKHTIKRTKKDN